MNDAGEGESVQEGEAEQHQLHSLSLHLPDIATGNV